MTTEADTEAGTRAPANQGRSVVIAGGGVAALETAAALVSLAGDRVDLTLIAPETEFVYRALTPHQSFDYLVAPRFALAELADHLGAALITDQLDWVDRDAHCVHTAAGAEVGFDALVLGLGADARPRYVDAITVGDPATAELTELVGDLKAGRVTRLALIAPEGSAWPLPLYEIALMAATLAAEHRLAVELTILTAEHAPMEIFGESASAQMHSLLSGAGVEIVTNTRCEVPSRKSVIATRGERGTAPRELSVDRVVALPQLFGPHLRGLPCAQRGFIPIDRFCRVVAGSQIYAAGDATDYAVKHGGIAAQQAAVVAASIAAATGAPVVPRPFHPTIGGLLLTGAEPRYLTARLTGGRPFGSQVTQPAPAEMPTKLDAPYLTELLAEIHS
jgi:sulfide:quinone oxidoreductase